MSAVALLLVLSSAVVHATWNLLVKRSETASPVFLWLYSAVAAALYLPVGVAVVVRERPAVGGAEALFLVGTVVIHSAYFLVLQHAYRRGDLSVVYPLSRGTGPLLAMVAAIALLGERPTPLGLASGGTVIAGVLLIATAGGGAPGATPGTRGGVPAGALLGVATGAFVAAYTVWDAYAVATLGIPPVLLEWCDNAGRALLFLPFALGRPAARRALWRQQRSAALAIGVLAPLAYILALTAYTMAPVSYVAPAREVSIVVGTLLGGRLLGEARPGRRAAAAAVVVVGVVGLAVA